MEGPSMKILLANYGATFIICWKKTYRKQDIHSCLSSLVYKIKNKI